MAQQVTPKEDKNSYEAVPTMVQQKAAFIEKTDTVRIEQTRNEPYFLSRVGLLRMTFNVNNQIKTYNGTASVFFVDKSKDLIFAITCAHNLQFFHAISNKIFEADSVYFERRNTIQEGSSAAIKEYEIIEKWIHPQFDPSKAVSSFDIAIIAFRDDRDQYFLRTEAAMDGLFNPQCERADFTHIFGYPACKRGELWGKSKLANISENKETNLLQYDIPTAGGQSGSPIIKVDQSVETIEEEMSSSILGLVLFCVFMVMLCVGNLFGFEGGRSFDLAVLVIIMTFVGLAYAENERNIRIIPRATVIKRECRIIGVHTTGSNEGNIGVKFTKESLKWIKQNVTDSHELERGETELSDSTETAEGEQLIGCLKETPFL